MEDLNKKAKAMAISKTINLLLLGETGVGKSTFINSMANYLTFEKFKQAKKETVISLIQSSFQMVDKCGRKQTIKVSGKTEAKNENIGIGESATQDCQSYVFTVGDDVRVSLIDTPGLVDTRGILQDKINCERILAYVGTLHELHAICILLEPNKARITAEFEYCIKEILSQLDKSAAKNIVFCFTHTRGANYTAGETQTCVMEIIKRIKKDPPHAEIPFEHNIFCFDNEAFRYLAAKDQIVLDDRVKEAAKQSWKWSSQQCAMLLQYIQGHDDQPGLVPHQVKTTVCVNEARRMINQLSQPLLDISLHIEDNIRVMERHRQVLTSGNQTLDSLRANLYIPVVNLKQTKLTQPHTVCSSAKCIEVLQVAGVKSTHYKTKCHAPCYLSNVPKEIVGDVALRGCAAMGGTEMCKQCGCSFQTHMHLYYTTEKVADRIVDKNAQSGITTKEQALQQTLEQLSKMEERVAEYRQEYDRVIKAAAFFAHFLQQNAISPFNDAYAKYIDHMIKREEDFGNDIQSLAHLQSLRRRYDEMRTTFDEALKKSGTPVATPTLINKEVQELKKLKHMGQVITNLYNAQKTARKYESSKSEYVHRNTEKKESSKQVKKAAAAANKKTDKKNTVAKDAPPKYEEVFSTHNAGGPPINRGNQFNRPRFPPNQFQQNFNQPFQQPPQQGNNAQQPGPSNTGASKKFKIEVSFDENDLKQQFANNMQGNQAPYVHTPSPYRLDRRNNMGQTGNFGQGGNFAQPGNFGQSGNFGQQPGNFGQGGNYVQPGNFRQGGNFGQPGNFGQGGNFGQQPGNFGQGGNYVQPGNFGQGGNFGQPGNFGQGGNFGHQPGNFGQGGNYVQPGNFGQGGNFGPRGNFGQGGNFGPRGNLGQGGNFRRGPNQGNNQYAAQRGGANPNNRGVQKGKPQNANTEKSGAQKEGAQKGRGGANVFKKNNVHKGKQESKKNMKHESSSSSSSSSSSDSE